MVVRARINELLDNVADTDEFLIETISLNEQRLVQAIKASQDRIINLMQQLEIRAGGRIEGIKINLKQAQQNHKALANIMEEEYGLAVDEVVGNLSEVSRFIERSWRDLGEAVSFTNLDKDMIQVLEGNTWDQFKAFGDDAVNQVAEAMYAQVISGGKFSDLLTAVQGALTGHVDARGRPMETYAKQFANDSVMNFHNEVNLKKGEDLGMEHFLYVGDIILTTRQFCQVRSMKVYSRRQIDSWTHPWRGKAGPAYEFRGGYNCRHHWRPIRKEWLTDEFGETTEDEMYALAQEDDFPAIKSDNKKITDLKAAHDASQNKSKALKVERKTASAARRKAINVLLKPLKDERRILKQQIAELKGNLDKQGKKLKRDVKAGKPPKTLTKKELKRTTKRKTPADMQDMGIESITDLSKTADDFFYDEYDDFTKQVIVPLTKETQRMLNFGNDFLRNGLDEFHLRLEVVNSRYIPAVGRHRNSYGAYQQKFYGGQVKLGAPGSSLATRKDLLSLGEWNSGTGPLHYYRHEVGHHVYRRMLSNRQVKDWERIFDQIDPDEISLYAGTNASECFSESFAAYINPNYRKGGLPRSVEGYLRKLLGA